MSRALAIDLGTVTTRVADDHGELVFEEDTLAALDADGGRLLAFGDEAVGLGARSGGRVSLQRPLRAGKLVDVDLAEAVVAELFRLVGVGRLEHPTVVLCSHVDASGVQRRALQRAFKRAGVRELRFIEQPIAVAIGAGLAIEEPAGSMVVDIGGGTTDVGVMALGGLVSATSVPIGGMDLDETVRIHLSRVHGLLVDRRGAEVLRRRFGTFDVGASDAEIEVDGRDAKTGRPATHLVAPGEFREALSRMISQIFAAAVRCVISAPPDLANDLVGSGLVLAGGGSRLAGLDRQLATATGIAVHVPAEPGRLAVRGAARCLGASDVKIPALSGLLAS